MPRATQTGEFNVLLRVSSDAGFDEESLALAVDCAGATVAQVGCGCGAAGRSALWMPAVFLLLLWFGRRRRVSRRRRSCFEYRRRMRRFWIAAGVVLVVAFGAVLVLRSGAFDRWREERAWEELQRSVAEPPPGQKARETVTQAVRQPEPQSQSQPQSQPQSQSDSQHQATDAEEEAPPCLDGPEPELLAAIEAQELGRVRSLVSAGADVDLCHHDGEGSTARPLELALTTRQFEIARVLLEAGANPNLTAQGGELPLDAATQKGAPEELIQLLVRRGARGTR